MSNLKQALAAATLAMSAAVALSATSARADDLPFTPGNFLEVTDVSIDDGHFLEYRKFLDSEAKAEDDFARSQGWLIETHIYANVHKRAKEPDVFILRTFKALPDAAEGLRRQKIMEDHLKMSAAQAEAGSGARASYRRIGDITLLQELILK